jgi:hypothetical protein
MNQGADFSSNQTPCIVIEYSLLIASTCILIQRLFHAYIIIAIINSAACHRLLCLDSLQILVHFLLYPYFLPCTFYKSCYNIFANYETFTTATSVKLMNPSNSPVPGSVAAYWRMVGEHYCTQEMVNSSDYRVKWRPVCKVGL